MKANFSISHYDDALNRITRAREEFHSLGLAPRGFIAPAWLLSAEGERAARDAGIDYTTRLSTVRDLMREKNMHARSLVYSVRNQWRRTASLAWNAALFIAAKQHQLVRLSLHPPDYSHREIWNQILRFVDELWSGAPPRPTQPGSTSSAQSGQTHEPLRSSYSFALQRAFGGMALSPVRFSRQLLRSARSSSRIAKRAGWILSPSPITTRSTGCLQIADLPDTFLSEQITTYFPQDPCKIHLLVWGISEAQHAEIATLRENIFDLQRYLQKRADCACGRAPALQHQWQTGSLAPRAADSPLQTFRRHQRIA